MKRVKLKRDMNHKNRLTLANFGGRFCYEVTNYRVDKFSFSDKLLLTFFFFFFFFFFFIFFFNVFFFLFRF